ncbi:hypothetical protein BDR04DRAFT_732812 [Suillus decipiens]|nr:hypothetical protein BDR04DRAFT_732812 [Suillus decipiens]
MIDSQFTNHHFTAYQVPMLSLADSKKLVAAFPSRAGGRKHKEPLQRAKGQEGEEMALIMLPGHSSSCDFIVDVLIQILTTSSNNLPWSLKYHVGILHKTFCCIDSISRMMRLAVISNVVSWYISERRYYKSIIRGTGTTIRHPARTTPTKRYIRGDDVHDQPCVIGTSNLKNIVINTASGPCKASNNT